MDKYKDNHVHTSISHDGISKIEEYVNSASKYNVDEITFTEHWDDYTGLKTNLKTLDVREYMTEYFKCKNDYKLKTNFGLEIGLQPDIKEKITNITKTYPLDFIIGSSHITCKKDMSMDKSFFEGLTRREAYLKYFREVLENVRLYKNEYDVYGHLDYVVRYGGYENKKIEYMEFNEILDAILSELVKNNKGIEINTAGFRYGLESAHPNISIIKRYVELGGEIITTGSDAHRIEHLAKDFDKVYELLEYLKIKYIAVFHNREPEFVKILK